MARDRAQRGAALQLRLRVRHQRAQHVRARAPRRFVAEHPPVGLREQPRIVIRRAAEHHAVDVRELALDRVPAREPAVGDDRQRRELALQPVHDVVAQRRHFAVLLRREPLQHRVARMDDEERRSPRCRNRADEIADEAVVLVAIEPDAVLDGDRNRHGVAHRPHAIGDERRLGHQARAEAAGLHALGRAADVEVDLVVTPALAQLRALRQRRRIAAAQLQRDRMLGRIEVEMARHVAVQQRAGGHHLGVEPRVARDEAQEEPAVPVGPVHHRRDAQAMIADLCSGGVFVDHF